MHSAQEKSLPDEGQRSRARSSVWAFWSSRGASVKRDAKRQNTGMGMARAGTVYDCVRTAVRIRGGGSGWPGGGGRLRLIATLHDPAVIRKILAHLALSHSGPIKS
jgi:hypothetical protein